LCLLDLCSTPALTRPRIGAFTCCLSAQHLQLLSSPPHLIYPSVSWLASYPCVILVILYGFFCLRLWAGCLIHCLWPSLSSHLVPSVTLVTPISRLPIQSPLLYQSPLSQDPACTPCHLGSLISLLRSLCQRISSNIGYHLMGNLSPTSSSFPTTLPNICSITTIRILASNYMGRKLPTSSHTLSSSLVPHHHSFLIDTRLQSKQPHLLPTPSPWLQSLAIQSDSPSGYWTTGEKLGVQWDIGMIGREHWYG